MINFFGLSWFVLATLILSQGPVPAASSAELETPLFKGKSIRIVVPFPPGGSVDLFARIVARHIPNYLPGKPKIIVVNMPGAGGIIGATYVQQTAKPDGLTWLCGSPSLNIVGMLDPKKRRKFDPRKQIHLVGTAEPGVTLVHSDLGVAKMEDLKNVDPQKLVIGSRSTSDTTYLTLRPYMNLLGIRGYKWAVGYPGSAAVAPAFARKEVTIFSVAAVNPLGTGSFSGMYKDGTAKILWQGGLLKSDGTVGGNEQVPYPTFTEEYVRVFGKPPGGIPYEALKITPFGSRALSKTITLPPGVPPAVVEALRRSFREMMLNPAFVREHKKVLLLEPAVADGKEADLILAALWRALTPKVAEYMSALTAGR